MPLTSRTPLVVIVGACIAMSGCTSTSESVDASARPATASAVSSSPTPLQSPSVAPTPEASPSTTPSPSATPAPTRTPTETQTPRGADAVISRIGNRQWSRIEATGTWRAECPVGRDDLRRLDVNFVDFDGVVQRGSLIAHQDSIEDLADIFTRLFEAGFPIERMASVEKYGGDVVRSLEANNTSAFNCRRPDQINAPTKDSPHANGRAIDINPYQNPWTDPRCDCWVPASDYATNREGPGVISEGSLPWELFTERGWIWQDIKVPDYMHFDTGFPSRPR